MKQSFSKSSLQNPISLTLTFSSISVSPDPRRRERLLFSSLSAISIVLSRVTDREPIPASLQRQRGMEVQRLM
ncbi:hypothetical protein MRB53_000997 [Persea americana]|uniref:Uncharacterized protein n=1 Tax=Persea americana TaxID=3435 RepID=A0ACC2MQL4_PERAE|nr:hypothetical protein MRB53_000997 [Persea americana]